MAWVKANDYIFDMGEVIAVGPLEPAEGEGTPQARVVLRAGFEFALKGEVAQRFRQMFLEGLSSGGSIRDCDSIQVSETRVFRSDEDAAGRTPKADGGK
jgi:hypothetical protein